MNTITFLHYLRERVLNYSLHEDSIVRIEVDATIPKNELRLVVIINEKYLPFSINDIDLAQYEKTIDFIMARIRKEFLIDP